jgi:small-conductance mechanosensitive channel
MKYILFSTIFSVLLFTGFSQQPADSNPYADSSVRQILKQEVHKQVIKTTVEIEERKALAQQAELFTGLRKAYQQAKDYVKHEVDTASIEAEIRQILEQSSIAGDGIFTNKGSIQTARNLSLSAILYAELLKKADRRKAEVESNMNVLLSLRNRIDSFALDSNLFYIPADSALFSDFFLKIGLLSGETASTDSALNLELKKTRELSAKTGLLVLSLKSNLQDIENYRKALSTTTSGRELASLWGEVGYVRPFREILHFSWLKNVFVLKFYTANHQAIFFLLLILFLALGSFLKLLKRAISKEMGGKQHIQSSLVLRNPYATALFVGLMLWQFLLPAPPFAIYAIAWTLAAGALLIILRGYIDRFWLSFWVMLMGLFLCASFLNSILQASRIERHFMVVLSAFGSVFGLFFAVSKHRSQLKEKRLIFFLWVFTILELIATVSNVYGRYNIGKALLTSGFIGLLVGIMLLWAVRLLTEIFQVAAEAYRDDEKNRYYIDFAKLGSEAPRLLYIGAAFGWLVLIGKNFYIYKQISEPIAALFTTPFSLGDYSFSLASVLLFLLTIIGASVVSKVVTFFYGGAGSDEAAKKGGIGSWLLLIRIAIIISGLFLAFAAAGIPLDRITIIFGGLSVGIGFGLQAIFESLISGVIIAFEKPINVGDEVEIGGQSGIMKSIGFRSSVISTFSGSDVVIPNNDLLKSHLVNWTLSNTNRRVGLLVGVDYESDLEGVIEILMKLLTSDDRILKNPPPRVLVKEFAASSIDLKLLFWVGNQHPWPYVKSDLMRQVKIAFAEAGINIPFPQLVVHGLGNTKKDENIGPASEQHPEV